MFSDSEAWPINYPQTIFLKDSMFADFPAIRTDPLFLKFPTPCIEARLKFVPSYWEKGNMFSGSSGFLSNLVTVVELTLSLRGGVKVDGVRNVP
jgi:hypothetical protein